MARAGHSAGRPALRPVTAWAVLKDAWRQRRTLGDARRSAAGIVKGVGR